MAGETYICANCHQTFDKIRSDEDAMAEAITDFGHDEIVNQDLAVVCEGCYRKIVEQKHAETALIDAIIASAIRYVTAWMSPSSGVLQEIAGRHMVQILIHDYLSNNLLSPMTESQQARVREQWEISLGLHDVKS